MLSQLTGDCTIRMLCAIVNTPHYMGSTVKHIMIIVAATAIDNGVHHYATCIHVLYKY